MIVPLLSFQVHAASPAVYGYVVEVTGAAWAIEANRTIVLHPRSPISVGDRIKLALGGMVEFIRESDYKSFRLTYNAGKNPLALPTAAPGTSLRKRLIVGLGIDGMNFRRVAAAMAKGVPEEIAAIVPLSPRGSMLHGPTEFRWRSPAAKGSTLWVISNYENNLSRRFDVPEGATSFRLPAEELRFFKPANRYIWCIKAGASVGKTVNFNIFEPARAEKVESELAQIDGVQELEPDERVVYKAQVLQKYRLFADSIALVDASERDVAPSLATLLRNLGWDGLEMRIQGIWTETDRDEWMRQWSGRAP